MLFEDIGNWDTIVNINNFFRVECQTWLMNQQVNLGGLDNNGQPKYVEVDETYFFHRKYHRGRLRRGKWIVGILERDSGRCWLEVVARRNAAALEQIITAHVLPGTIIVTDAWAAYANVDQINNGVYQHEVVVHAQHFVDPVHPEINTQAIEGLWMQAKRKLRYQSGTSRVLFPSYLSAFQWHFSHKLHAFGQYLKLLSDNYHI
jgi:transposase-like protein